MPGPPAEMHAMWQNSVLSRLQEIKTGSVIISRIIKIWGISESALNDMFIPLYASANPTLAIYVKNDGIHIRIAAKAANEAEARTMIAPVEEKLRAELDEAVWGADNDTLEGVAHRLLSEKKMSLAVIEGYSGGQLIESICESLIASPFVKGGIVAGSDETLKAAGIAASLYANPDLTADAIRRHFDADIGISVTDFPPENKGPGETGGTVYVGIAYKDTRKNIPLTSVRERARAKGWVVSAALFELIKILRAG
jgi:nicotinamide-nucleotide amidase